MEDKLHMHPAQRELWDRIPRIKERRELVRIYECKDCGGDMREYRVYPVGYPQSFRRYFKCQDCGIEIRDV